MDIIIELFPANKTCEQGCKTCPLARKSSEVTATEINADVQMSFSILEEILQKKSFNYELNFAAGLPHLFPKLRFPKLIKKTRFETRNDVGLGNNAWHFSENVRTLLQDHKIDPKILGFSVVPQHPVVSADDGLLINRLIELVGSWYFTKYKTIDVTVRSNLIAMPIFKKVISHLFVADKTYLKEVLKKQGAKICGYSRKAPRTVKMAGGRMYVNQYSAKIGSRKIIILNRVIAGMKATNLKKKNHHEAIEATVIAKQLIDFAITPRGVMLMHSSLAINNPVLWLSHNDFRKALETESAKSNFSLTKFVQKIIMNNVVMYDVVPKHFVKKDIVLTNDHFLALFEHYRPKLFRKL